MPLNEVTKSNLTIRMKMTSDDSKQSRIKFRIRHIKCNLRQDICKTNKKNQCENKNETEPSFNETWWRYKYLHKSLFVQDSKLI